MVAQPTVEIPRTPLVCRQLLQKAVDRPTQAKTVNLAGNCKHGGEILKKTEEKIVKMAVIKQHSESAGMERTGHFTSYVKKKKLRRHHSANTSREHLDSHNDVEAVIDVKNFKYAAH